MITTEVHGLKELEEALKELGSEVAGKNGGLVRTALMGASLPVLKTAKATAPYSGAEDDDNLHLRDVLTRSRRKEIEPDIKANEVIDVGLFARGKGKRVVYGQFLEFGTSKMAAQPFLRRALETNQQESIRLFRKKLAMGVERVAKKIGHSNAAKVGARIKKL